MLEKPGWRLAGITILWPLLAGLYACDSRTPAGASGPGGAGVTEIPLDLVHILASSDSIVRIADIQPTVDGTVWVLNRLEPYLFAFDQDGQILRAWGRHGRGPGEFLNPSALVGDPGSIDVWVYDRSAHWLVRVNAPEASPEVLELPADPLPAGGMVSTESVGTVTGRTWIRAERGGFVVARSRLGLSAPVAARLWQVDLVRWARDGAVRTVLSPAEVLGNPSSRFGQAGMYMPFPLWATCPDQGMALYDPLLNELRLFSPEGDEIGSRALPAEREIQVTKDRLFQAFSAEMVEQGADTTRLRADLEANWAEFSRTLSAAFPEYSELTCVGQDVLWLQLFSFQEGNVGRGRAWYRIGPEGGLQEILFPRDFRPLRFTDDRIWGVRRDEWDVESVAWIDIRDLPGPGT